MYNLANDRDNWGEGLSLGVWSEEFDGYLPAEKKEPKPEWWQYIPLETYTPEQQETEQELWLREASWAIRNMIQGWAEE